MDLGCLFWLFVPGFAQIIILNGEEFFSRCLLKKRLWHRCFPVNFAKFLRTPFLQNTSGRLLLKGVSFNFLFKHKFVSFVLIVFQNLHFAFFDFVKLVEVRIERNLWPTSTNVFGVHNTNIKKILRGTNC